MTSPWSHEVEEAALENLGSSLWGAPPPFPIDALTDKLQERLNLPALRISKGTTAVRKREALLEGLSAPCKWLEVAVTGITGSVFLIFSEPDLLTLINRSLELEGKTIEHLTPLLEGFLTHTGLQALLAAEEAGAFPGLSTHILDGEALPSTISFVTDYTLELDDHTITARLAIPFSFQNGYRALYADTRRELSEAERKSVDVIPTLVVGEVHLKIADLEKLEEGDFLLLDRCSYDPTSERKEAQLHLGEKALLRGALTNGTFTATKRITSTEEINNG